MIKCRLYVRRTYKPIACSLDGWERIVLKRVLVGTCKTFSIVLEWRIGENAPESICLNRVLKCHWDQNFGIPYFYIFEHSLWFLVTMPNFNLLRQLEVAFFGRFLSRFCGRHYWPLFRKLACEWAEVTSEAHLKPSAFTWLLATGK